MVLLSIDFEFWVRIEKRGRNDQNIKEVLITIIKTNVIFWVSDKQTVE